MSILNPYRITALLLLIVAAITIACGGTEVVTERVVETVVVEKEVVKEVEKEKVVEVGRVLKGHVENGFLVIWVKQGIYLF